MITPSDDHTITRMKPALASDCCHLLSLRPKALAVQVPKAHCCLFARLWPHQCESAVWGNLNPNLCITFLYFFFLRSEIFLEQRLPQHGAKTPTLSSNIFDSSLFCLLNHLAGCGLLWGWIFWEITRHSSLLSTLVLISEGCRQGMAATREHIYPFATGWGTQNSPCPHGQSAPTSLLVFDQGIQCNKSLKNT